MKKKILIVLLGVISISFTGCLSMIFPELNNPPVITSTPIETATVGETYTYPVEASDPEGDVLTYSLTTKPSGMTIDGNSGVITWTPTATGSYDVIVEVSDGKLTDTQTFTITVSAPPNQAPTITLIPDASVILGETFNYTVDATDPDGDDLTYTLITEPTDMTISTAGIITWTPTATGSYDVIVEVSDGKLTDTQTFTITVSAPPNQAPTITLIPDASVILGETFNYTVNATDPDGDDLTYSLLTGSPSGMSINGNTGIITWTPTATGSYDVIVEVSDGKLTDTQTFTITVSAPPNQAPTITLIPDASVILGETFNYTVNATDPDGDDLTYSLTDGPDEMVIDPNTGAISWTPTATGSYDVTVEVSDGSESATQSFTITVNEALLISIEVLPVSMTLEIGESKTIDSVTAHYSDGTEIIITPLTACTYVSDKSNATVSPDGVITGVSLCTASTPVTITVSYTGDDITVTDTVSVVVTNPSPG